MANLPDPSTLTDEELDKILAGEELEEDTQDENPDVDSQDDADTTGDDQEEDVADDSEEEDKDKSDKKDKPEPKTQPEDKEDEPKISRREQLRVRQLLEKFGPPTASDKPASNKPEVKDALDYDKDLTADDDTKQKLRQDRDKVASDSFNQGLERAKTIEFKTLLEIDSPRVEAKYPQLDRNSDEFKEEAAADVNLLYLQLAGWNPQTQEVKNPNFRYSNFVDTIFTLVKDLASEEAKEITKNVKKQAAQTGLRPDGSRTKKLNLNKAPGAMTDEELDAYLAQAIPS